MRILLDLIAIKVTKAISCLKVLVLTQIISFYLVSLFALFR